MIVMVGIQLHSIEYLSMHGYFESVEHYLRVSPGNPHHPTNTSKQDDSDREPILEILRQGGYDLDDKTTFHDGVIASLPKWSEVTSFYGPPRVIGLETCKAFRDKVPLDKRMIGAAGIFNSGTNFLFYLLKKNCWNPKKKGSGMLWQVPWGKHRPESSRGNHVAKKSEKKEDVLPVVGT